MKVLICLVIFLALGNCLTWEEYKDRFGKVYTTEDGKRRNYFINQKGTHIEPHNQKFEAGTEIYKLDYNALTDAGFIDEFEKCFKTITWDSNFPKGTSIELNTDNLPQTFELEMSRVVVMDQTNNGDWNYMKCNYGWAFAVAKAVEIFGINNSRYPSSISLSPQQLIDCWTGDNCLKGIPHKAFQYMVNFTQVLYSDESYEYVGQKREFCTTDIVNYPSAVSLRGFSVLDDKANENEIKAVLVTKKAPLVFEINPYSEKFLNYKSGVYSLPTNGGAHSHFMLIVGYGTETINEKEYPYWKVLNSWGPTWGENGLMKLLRTKVPIKKFVFPSKF